MPKSKFISTAQIILRILAVILLVEFLIMLVLGSTDIKGDQVTIALIDIVLLALLATPAIYIWIVMPFVSARDNAYQEISGLAMTDGLTQLANRRHFDHVVEMEFNRHERSKTELSLIMLDIDEFKSYNDFYGHVAGDECLRKVSKVLSSVGSRPADFVARYGGEEFVCILPETGIEGALIIAEKMRKSVEAQQIPHKFSHVSDFVTVSLGVATSSFDHATSSADLILQADEFLYLAKNKGRNCTGFDIDSRDKAKDTHFVKLVWKDNYCSGNNLIDTQHKKLFNMTDLVLDAFFSRKPESEIEELIDRLMDSIIWHFEDEINILEDLGYEGLQHHMYEHDRLINQCRDLVAKNKAGKGSIGEVFQFLAYDVIASHILTEDREYFEFTRINEYCENEEISKR